jgi:hypothetical protein
MLDPSSSPSATIASPGDLQSVFRAILEQATRICEANFGILQFYEDGASPLNVGTRVIPFAAPGVVFCAVGGLRG